MDPKTRERLEALIRRAMHATTPTEEARTSAMVAIQLLSKHGLGGAISGPPDDIFYRARMKALEGQVRLLDAACKNYETTIAALRRELSERPKVDVKKPATGKTVDAWMWDDPMKVDIKAKPKTANSWERSKSRTSKDLYVEIASKYSGHCKECGKRYKEGERVAWKKGVGATHWECREYFEAP